VHILRLLAEFNIDNYTSILVTFNVQLIDFLK